MRNLWRKLFPVRVELVHSPVAQMVYFEGSVLVLMPSGRLYELKKDSVTGVVAIQHNIELRDR